MTALEDTPGNRAIAALFWILLRAAAIALAALSVLATTTGVYNGLGATPEAAAFAAAAGAMNVVGIFLFYRGTVLWSQSKRVGAIVCFLIGSAIIATAVNYDRIGLEVLLTRVSLIDQRAADQGQNRDALIAAAEARVTRADADLTSALRGKEIAQEALDRESATGFGERSQAAAEALEEANADLAQSRANLLAAEEALAEARALPAQGDVSISDAAGAVRLSDAQVGAIIWGLSILLETVSALLPSLLGLRISDRVRRRASFVSPDQQAAFAELGPMGDALLQAAQLKGALRVIAEMDAQPTPASQPATQLVPPPAPVQGEAPSTPTAPRSEAMAAALGATFNKSREWYLAERQGRDAANDAQSRGELRDRQERAAPQVRRRRRGLGIVEGGKEAQMPSREIVDIAEGYRRDLRARAEREGADMARVEDWIAKATNDADRKMLRQLVDYPETTTLPTAWFEGEKHSQGGQGDG